MASRSSGFVAVYWERIMKCPFFQAECLKENCTAYKIKDEYFNSEKEGHAIIGVAKEMFIEP